MPVKGTIARFVDEDADRDYNGYPNTVPRKVNDVPCCLAFVICCIAVGMMQQAISVNHTISRYEGLTDYNGKFCGVSKFLVDKPFLYFCKDSRHIGAVTHETMARRDRMCVSHCGDVNIPNCPAGRPSIPYPSEEYGGILCLPEDRGERKIVRKEFLSDPDVGLFLLGIAFSRAWPAIFYSIVLSIVLAFVYLCMARFVTKGLVMAGLFAIVVSGSISGLFLMFTAMHGGADGITGSGDEMISFISGALVLFISFVTFWVGMTWNNNISSSIACIKAGCECIWDSPSIVFEPFLHLAIKLSVLVLSTVGALRLMEYLDQDTATYAGETSVRVSMHYTLLGKLMLLFHVFVSLWIFEVNNCVSYFATSYASQMWFFAPYDKVAKTKESPPFASCQAYSVAFRYSMGTIVYGAFCNVVFRPSRMFFGAVFYSMQTNPNGCASTIGKCLACFFNYWDGFLKYMSPYAFMDVSLNGSRYCKAAYFATTTMDHQTVAFFSLHSASWLVCFVGHTFVAAIGGIFTYYMCKTGAFMERPGMEEYQNDFYIPRPSLMGFLAAGICWIAAHPFLVLPGHVSDNLLFCFAIERYRRNMLQGVVQSASYFTRLTTCTGRDEQQQHQVGSTSAHPPATHSLLEEARMDLSWW